MTPEEIRRLAFDHELARTNGHAEAVDLEAEIKRLSINNGITAD